MAFLENGAYLSSSKTVKTMTTFVQPCIYLSTWTISTFPTTLVLYKHVCQAAAVMLPQEDFLEHKNIFDSLNWQYTNH